MLVRGEEDELAHPIGLPRIHEIVQHPMKGLPAEGRIPRGASFWGDVHAIFDGGGSQHPKFGRQVIGQSLHDQGITAQWKVRSMLLTGSDGNDQTGVRREKGRYFCWAEFLEPSRGRSAPEGGIRCEEWK